MVVNINHQDGSDREPGPAAAHHEPVLPALTLLKILFELRFHLKGRTMGVRRLISILFTLFFVAFVPVALACEVSAQGHSSCKKASCNTLPQGVNCTAKSAFDSAPTPKISGDDTPQPTTLSIPVVLPQGIEVIPGPLNFHIKFYLPHPPSTLFAQAVLLLI